MLKASAVAGKLNVTKLPRALQLDARLLEFFISGGTPVRFLIALDEVGRGCLAGPVVAGASLWRVEDSSATSSLKSHLPWIRRVGDSKKLSAETRRNCCDLFSEKFSHCDFEMEKGAELSFSGLTHPARRADLFDRDIRASQLPRSATLSVFPLGVWLGSASAPEIDSLNIWRAVQLAMGRALVQLSSRISAGFMGQIAREMFGQTVVLVDGKLSVRVPAEFGDSLQVLCVQGDGRFCSLGLASIIAKVKRDQLMESLTTRFPNYDFDKHKGYGTRRHWNALEQHGPIADFHRMSFLGRMQSAPESASRVASQAGCAEAASFLQQEFLFDDKADSSNGRTQENVQN